MGREQAPNPILLHECILIAQPITVEYCDALLPENSSLTESDSDSDSDLQEGSLMFYLVGRNMKTLNDRLQMIVLQAPSNG